MLDFLMLVVVSAPVCLVLFLGIATLLDRPLSERAIGRCVQYAVWVGLISALLILATMLIQDQRHLTLLLGNWVDLHEIDFHGHYHYHFAIKFVFDRLSVPFVILSFVLCGTIGAFATRYMHRERGFNRFFSLFTIFLLGMIVTSIAGTIETLFAGWELVGLSSAMLVAFFHERPSPVRNGLHVWSIYRVSDAALLIAAVVLHHLQGEGDFDKLLGNASWPDQIAKPLSEYQILLIGSLLLLAAAGKSALVPFSGWLPRAMEGPTPSSAVFYGALSVHLGAFLLLRTSPLLDESLILSTMVIALGLLTAAMAALFARVQTDIKSALSFASLTQVGIIVAEIGLSGMIGCIGGTTCAWFASGLRYFALIHILGHACLRTLQFVRAPTLLHDYRIMENALGERITAREPGKLLSGSWRLWLYRFAIERGYLDAYLKDYVVTPVLKTWLFCDGCERQWLGWLAGKSDPSALKLPHQSSPVEDSL